MSAIATKPLYVYGITSQTTPPPGLRGIAAAPVEIIGHDGVGAVVSELVAGEDLGLGREDLNLHADVLAEIQKAGPVLPMRFGMVVQEAGEVEERLIGPYREALQQQLAYVTGRVELRLRASYDEDTLLREVVQQDPEVASLRAALAGKSAEATYYDRIRLGELVAAAVERRREQDAAQLLAALEPFTVDLRVSEPSHPRVALQVSMLAEQSRLAEVDQVVDGLGAAHAGRIRMKYTGPLPPYSFVELTGA